MKPVIAEFLQERGLKLSEEKTHCVHIRDGFDFLGFNIRKYGDKLLTKPAKENVKTFLSGVRQIIKSNPSIKTSNLIRLLTPKIRGWSNYYRHGVSRKTFEYIDYQIYTAVWRWCKRRHPRKNVNWIRRKYFRTHQTRQWIFFGLTEVKRRARKIIDLYRATNTPIRRHVKIRSSANPYDPNYIEYFRRRTSKCAETLFFVTTGFLQEPYKGLSRVPGNWYARF